ncbi:unnamed protein product [Protopolystoma xenopodis]|uniref:Uncharacterized protein n=1 Tax=Protopolystoma xenopodis TaxID=117903 RepID=A0A3S5CL40_9PLAT|nr:unnamed protein product [Protopolystoma xenopodis]
MCPCPSPCRSQVCLGRCTERLISVGCCATGRPAFEVWRCRVDVEPPNRLKRRGPAEGDNSPNYGTDRQARLGPSPSAPTTQQTLCWTGHKVPSRRQDCHVDRLIAYIHVPQIVRLTALKRLNTTALDECGHTRSARGDDFRCRQLSYSAGHGYQH